MRGCGIVVSGSTLKSMPEIDCTQSRQPHLILPHMTASLLTGEALPLGPLLVWVFAPYLETADPNLDYYSDYSQSHAEYARVFAALGWSGAGSWSTTDNVDATIDRDRARVGGAARPVVLNLCDGDELNDVPGVERHPPDGRARDLLHRRRRPLLRTDHLQDRDEAGIRCGRRPHPALGSDPPDAADVRGIAGPARAHR